MADPYGAHTRVGVMWVQEGIPLDIMASRHGSSPENPGAYEPVRFRTSLQDENMFMRLKLGDNVSLARLNMGPVRLEAGFSGYLNSVFSLFGGSDVLGFDGSYGIYGAIDFFDIVTIRGGMHHFSGHYGDEIIDDAILAAGTYGRFVEYTRDNSWYAGISVRPSSSFHLYFDTELPMGTSWLRPAVHVPEHTQVPSGGDKTQAQKTSEQEGIYRPDSYASSYKAWRLNGGLEFRIPVASSSFIIAADVQAHQDGQTKHQVGGYDSDNPWEFEFSLGVGFEIPEAVIPGRVLRLEAFYHDGRFPLLNFFYQRSRYISVGIGISG